MEPRYYYIPMTAAAIIIKLKAKKAKTKNIICGGEDIYLLCDFFLTDNVFLNPWHQSLSQAQEPGCQGTIISAAADGTKTKGSWRPFVIFCFCHTIEEISNSERYPLALLLSQCQK